MKYNVYREITKVLDDDVVNGEQVEWKTINGNKIALNEEGEVVAGNQKAVGGSDKVNEEKDLDSNDYSEIIKHLDKLDFESALNEANKVIKENPIKQEEFKQIIQNVAKKHQVYKHGAKNKGIIDGAQAALEALVYKNASISEAFGIAVKTCFKIYEDQMENHDIKKMIIQDLKSELIKKLEEKKDNNNG